MRLVERFQRCRIRKRIACSESLKRYLLIFFPRAAPRSSLVVEHKLGLEVCSKRRSPTTQQLSRWSSRRRSNAAQLATVSSHHTQLSWTRTRRRREKSPKSQSVSCREEPDFLLIIMFMFLFVNLANNSKTGERSEKWARASCALSLVYGWWCECSLFAHSRALSGERSAKQARRRRSSIKLWAQRLSVRLHATRLRLTDSAAWCLLVMR